MLLFASCLLGVPWTFWCFRVCWVSRLFVPQDRCEGQRLRCKIGVHLLCCFRCCLRFRHTHHLLGMTAALVVGRMWWFSFGQLAVAARRPWGSISLFWAVFVQMAATTSQAAKGLLAICPEFAKRLAVVALSKGSLCFACLHFDGDVAKSRKVASFLGLRALGKVNRYNGESTEDRRMDDLCLTVVTSNSKSTNPSNELSAGVFCGSWSSRLWYVSWISGRRPIGQLDGVQVAFNCQIVHHVPPE
jgi:hypothetical protein